MFSIAGLFFWRKVAVNCLNIVQAEPALAIQRSGC
jgi:hypothetical protein